MMAAKARPRQRWPLPLPQELTATATATRTASVTPPPSATPTTVPTPTLPLARLLEQIEVPARDLYSITERLKGLADPLPRIVNATPPAYSLGDQETLWVADLDANRNYTITATLRHISAHLYMWVQNGEQVEDAALARSAEEFERQIYPTNRYYFGSEWSPGVDNDVHLTVLNARFQGAAGYFSGADEFPRAVNPYSNQREMFYINLAAKRPGTQEYARTLAHEFQHMIHWYADANEETWVNEGASQIAVVLNGYGQNDISRFANNPDVQLNDWADTPAEAGLHYDASYLMTSYFLDRFGAEMLRELIREPSNGAASFDKVLAARQTGLTFTDLIADWAIANYGAGLGERYAYKSLDVRAQPTAKLREYPASGEGQVHQFAADYIELIPNTAPDLRIAFTGTITVPIVPNQAHSGRLQWWSNRGDSSNMTLTRAFDLRGLTSATLSYWLWYDIEDGWDYAYVEVSTDAGKTWKTLPGRYTTQADPSGQNLGHAYTGLSTGWVQEQLDLSAHAGKQILVRFEYITDDAVNHVGLCLDDIRISELGYADDAESGDGGWIAAGFARIDNVLPQHYAVQVITLGKNPGVQRIELDKEGRGALDIRGLGREIDRAVLVVSALTPVTTELASYQYAVSPAGQ